MSWMQFLFFCVCEAQWRADLHYAESSSSQCILRWKSVSVGLDVRVKLVVFNSSHFRKRHTFKKGHYETLKCNSPDALRLKWSWALKKGLRNFPIRVWTSPDTPTVGYSQTNRGRRWRQSGGGGGGKLNPPSLYLSPSHSLKSSSS